MFNRASQEGKLHQTKGRGAGSSNSFIHQLEWFSRELGSLQGNEEPVLHEIRRGWSTMTREHWKGDSYADWAFDEITFKVSTNINILQKRFESGKLGTFFSAMWIVFTSPHYSLGQWTLNTYQLSLSALWKSPTTSFSFLPEWIIHLPQIVFFLCTTAKHEFHGFVLGGSWGMPLCRSRLVALTTPHAFRLAGRSSFMKIYFPVT